MQPARALLALLVAASVAIGSVACDTASSPAAPSGSSSAAFTVTYASIEYKVTGTATSSASLTYANASEGTSQLSSATLPWTYKFSAKSGQFLYISAQNNGSFGCVDVEILKDGRAFKSSFSCGAFVIATASGSF